MALTGAEVIHKIHSCCGEIILTGSVRSTRVGKSCLLPEYSIEHTSIDEHDQRGKKDDGAKAALMSEVQMVEQSTGEWPAARRRLR